MKKHLVLTFVIASAFLFPIEGLRAQNNVVTNPATAATNTITPTADVVPLTIDNASTTYTSDLQEWKRNGTTVVRFDHFGDLVLGVPSTANSTIIFNNGGNSHKITLSSAAPSADRAYGFNDIGKSGNIAISDANTTMTMYMQNNVNMTAAVGTSFTIFTVPAAYNFVCTEVMVVTTSISGFVSSGTFKIGTTPTGSELLGGGVGTPPITAPTFNATYLSGTSLPVVTGGNNVYCSIASSAVATAFSVNIFVKGFFYQ